MPILKQLKGFDGDADKLFLLASWMLNPAQSATLLAVGKSGADLPYAILKDKVEAVLVMYQTDRAAFRTCFES